MAEKKTTSKTTAKKTTARKAPTGKVHQAEGGVAAASGEDEPRDAEGLTEAEAAYQAYLYPEG